MSIKRAFKLWSDPLPNGRLLRPKMYAGHSCLFENVVATSTLCQLEVPDDPVYLVIFRPYRFFLLEGCRCHASCANTTFIKVPTFVSDHWYMSLRASSKTWKREVESPQVLQHTRQAQFWHPQGHSHAVCASGQP